MNEESLRYILAVEEEGSIVLKHVKEMSAIKAATLKALQDTY